MDTAFNNAYVGTSGSKSWEGLYHNHIPEVMKLVNSAIIAVIDVSFRKDLAARCTIVCLDMHT